MKEANILKTSPTCLLHVGRGGQGSRSNHTQGYIAHFRKNHHKLRPGNWNILTLTKKDLELVEGAKKCPLHIAGISTKRRGCGIVDLNGG